MRYKILDTAAIIIYDGDDSKQTALKISLKGHCGIDTYTSKKA